MATVLTTPKKILDKLNSGVVVSASDLDIRDLSADTDSVSVEGLGGIFNTPKTGQTPKSWVITQDGEGTTTEEVYTVPGGKVVYLIAVRIARHVGDGRYRFRIWNREDSTDTDVDLITYAGDLGTVANHMQTLTYPVFYTKFTAGQIIKVELYATDTLGTEATLFVIEEDV